MMEQKTQFGATEVSANSDFIQFRSDYWNELKNHDPLLAMLTSWNVFEQPNKHKPRKYYRFFVLIVLLSSSVGLPVVLRCSGFTEAAVILVSLVVNTIPIELLNLVWIRIVKPASEVKSRSSLSNCGQNTLRFFGSILGLGVLAYSVTFCLLTFLGSHPDCTSTEVYMSVIKIVLIQFLAMPFYMCLPYWREQSMVLSFLGQLGPVLGLIMHVQVFGFHPSRPGVTIPETNFRQLNIVGLCCILSGAIEIIIGSLIFSAFTGSNTLVGCWYGGVLVFIAGILAVRCSTRTLTAIICFLSYVGIIIAIQSAVYDGFSYILFKDFSACCNGQLDCGGTSQYFKYAQECVTLNGATSSNDCYCTDTTLKPDFLNPLSCDYFEMTSSGVCADVPGKYDTELLVSTLWLAIGGFLLLILVVTSCAACLLRCEQCCCGSKKDVFDITDSDATMYVESPVRGDHTSSSVAVHDRL